ncbi:hypothetical protein D3C78_972390 [compost metagenome]
MVSNASPVWLVFFPFLQAITVNAANASTAIVFRFFKFRFLIMVGVFAVVMISKISIRL